MARRRTQSEATCREDAAIATAVTSIVEALARRHPLVLSLKMATRSCNDAAQDLSDLADTIAAKAPVATEG
jgi:hypothetical protein